MFNIGHAKIFASEEEVEQTAIEQIHKLVCSPVGEGQKIAIMPDVHAGAGCVIGFTSTYSDKVVPNLIGVDIGCGVLTRKIGHEEINFKKLDEFIRAEIPCGFSKRDKAAAHVPMLSAITEVCEQTGQDLDSVVKSLGTLGSGNHFIELGRDERGDHWVTIHSGSRNFGLKVCQFHQQIAKKTNPNGDLSYLTGEDKDNYLRHMAVAQSYASHNRAIMMDIILFHLNPDVGETVESVHNYIDLENNIIRKGAISALAGQSVVIPWNMADGVIIGVGKGNSDWNFSAPHGAGRVLGRGQAKKLLELSEYQDKMQHVYSSCVSADTIDESPMAYKTPESVEKHLGETVEITHRVKAVYNFKSS